MHNGLCQGRDSAGCQGEHQNRSTRNTILTGSMALLDRADHDVGSCPDGTLLADAVLARLLVCAMSIRATHGIVSRAPPYTAARPLSNTEGVMWKSR
jgi:hypothetical protein